MRQGDVMKTLGLAGLAVAVGYLFQSKPGARKLRSVSRELRSIADSAGDGLTKLGRSVGLVDSASRSSGTGKRRTSGASKSSGTSKSSGSSRKKTKKAS